MLNIYDVFCKIQAAAMPSGYEKPCAEVIAELAKPFCDEITTDKLGNLIAHKRGKGTKIMMAAHMDTIGFLITHIDKKGFLRFANVGGFAPYSLIAKKVRFECGIFGSIQCEKEGKLSAENLDKIKITDLYIDIGATSDAEAKEKVRVHDIAVFAGVPEKIGDDKIISPYCDDLIACAAQICAMEQLKKTNNDVYFVFTVQEEVGGAGAKTAAYAINPDYGFCMDVTSTGDCLATLSNMQVSLGCGPAIKVKDASLICNPQAVKALRSAADIAKISYQNEVLLAGGTDAAVMQITKAGVLASGISIPCRYIHTPNEMVSIKDVEQCATLMAQVAQIEL